MTQSFVVRARVSFAVVTTLALVTTARAQCLDWASGFQTPGAIRSKIGSTPSDAVLALRVFDDGSGSALYCAGRFTQAGGVDVRNIARWDGASFSPLGSGIHFPNGSSPDGEGKALAVFDDGTGPALFVGGFFSVAGGGAASHVAKWNGAAWSALGSGVDDEVRALLVFDDGSGSALYAAGEFTSAGGAPALGVARWNGTSWSALGTGIAGTGNALAVFDGGGGPELHAGGTFHLGGGPPTVRVVRWDGSAWHALGSDLDNGEARALLSFDDGSGDALYAGGTFTVAGGAPALRIARWNGSAWSAVGGGMNGDVDVLAVLGGDLYAGGTFGVAGGTTAREVARWDGSTWSSVGAGVGTEFPSPPSLYGVRALTSFDAGSGSELHAGGKFDASATRALNNVAHFDGADWLPLAAGNGIPREVRELAVYDDGSDLALYVAGAFQTAGMIAANGIARWDGASWSTVGTDVIGDRIHAFAVHDFGAGSRLVAAGGDFASRSVRAWDGLTWTQIGASFNNTVRALCVYDDGAGPALFVGGDFSNGGMQHIARWNGSSWEALGGGVNGRVIEMIAFNDGTGPNLIVGGEFTQAGGVFASGVARWNGAQWSALGSGISGNPVLALEVFDSGSGAELYGAATPGLVLGVVARWNGVSWTTLATTPVGQTISELKVFGDGMPDAVALYAAGRFASIDGVPAQNLARYDGASWSAVGAGTDGVVNVLCAWNDGSDAAPDLFLGGDFGHAGGLSSSGLAQWRGCTGPGEPFCFADGSLATACPCAPPDLVPVPSGSPFAGCASVTNLHGASFAATGTTNPDTLALVASGVTPGGTGMFFKGDAQIASGIAIADGVRCVGGSFVRFGLQAAVSGVSRYPNVPLGYTIPVSVVGSTPPGSGLTGYYQFVYRSAQPGFCGPGTLNFTNAYRAAW